MSDVGYIELTLEQFHRLPRTVQEAIRAYGSERPQGWGKPSRIYLTQSRIRELERLMAEATDR